MEAGDAKDGGALEARTPRKWAGTGNTLAHKTHKTKNITGPALGSTDERDGVAQGAPQA